MDGFGRDAVALMAIIAPETAVAAEETLEPGVPHEPATPPPPHLLKDRSPPQHLLKDRSRGNKRQRDDSILEPKTAVAAKGFKIECISSASESEGTLHLSPRPTRYLDYETQGVLKKGTDEERNANNKVMETKRDCIIAALAGNEHMPESVRGAHQRLRWFNTYIA